MSVSRPQFTLLSLTLGLVLIGCSSSSSPTATPGPQTTENAARAIIFDATGKPWDVTHARDNYNMPPGKFQFGLGPDAIKPIRNPRFASEGDPEYPASNDSFLVMGVDLAGDPRAYSISTMSAREVVDEKFGDAHVAVAY